MGFLLLAATMACTAAIPYVLKAAADALHHAPHQVGRLSGLLALLALAAAGLRFLSRTRVFALGREVESALRRAFYDHLLRQDHAFFQQTPAGELLFRGSNDIIAVRLFIGPGFLQLSNTLLAYAFSLPVMFHLDASLALLVLAPYPVALLCVRLLTRRLFRLSRQSADRFGELTAFVQESLAGVAVLRNHGREAERLLRFQERQAAAHRAHTDHARLQSLFAPLMTLAGGMSGALLLWQGGQKVAAQTLSIGDFVAFSGYAAMLVWPTIGLGWILTVLQRGLAGLDRLHQSLSVPLASASPEPGAPLPPTARILVHDLHATHPGREREILSGLSLEIAPGAFVGLVGQVGSGKSTLLRCLAGLHPCSPGSILLDDRPLGEIDESALRAHVAFVPQEAFLFSRTLEENLLYGHPSPSRDLAWELARQAALDGEIRRFPQEMATPVGARGVTLSGGQRQRVALARALAGDTPVLLLDDVFASVDAATEGAILDQLLARKTTLLLVCHRVAALHRADVIHLLDQGRIIASGSHARLWRESPLYRALHAAMSRDERLESLA